MSLLVRASPRLVAARVPLTRWVSDSGLPTVSGRRTAHDHPLLLLLLLLLLLPPPLLLHNGVRRRRCNDHRKVSKLHNRWPPDGAMAPRYRSTAQNGMLSHTTLLLGRKSEGDLGS